MRAPKKLVLLGCATMAFGVIAALPAVTATAAPSATGVQSRHEFETYDPQHKPARPGGGGSGSKTLAYGGGVDGIGVTSGGKPKVYLVFWGTQWGTSSADSNGNLAFTTDSYGGAGKLQQLFKGLGSNNEGWSKVMTQYCDGSTVAKGATSCPKSTPASAFVQYPSGGVLAGAWYDNASSEPAKATQSQLGAEAVRAAQHFGNSSASSNRDAQYVILSAKGTNPDGYLHKGFCAWHTYTTSSVGDVAFTNMPYVMDRGTACGANIVSGAADGYTIVEGHEYSETITDQNPAGGWTASSGQENADECAWITSGQGAIANVSFSTGSYPLQSTWSNKDNACVLQ